AAIARLCPDAVVVPLALRYEFGQTERPVLYCQIGEPLPHEREVATAVAAQEHAVARLMNELDARISTKVRPDRAECFHQHQSGWFTRLAEYGLAKLTRGDIPTERTALPPAQQGSEFSDPKG
ncbi:MAG: hypothetical protein AAFQ82_27460, partial [Myxococcota bacterium]